MLTWFTILIHLFYQIIIICIGFALQGLLEHRALRVPAVEPGKDYLYVYNRDAGTAGRAIRV